MSNPTAPGCAVMPRCALRHSSNGIPSANCVDMPKTYDEIVRKTVPEPDSSLRPSPEQVKQAYEGFRAMDPDEQALQQRVLSAIGGRGDITVEVDHDRVILRGRVRDAGDLRRLPEIVRGLDGVGTVDDQLVIG